LATFDNPDGLLKTGMTGEGKIAGPSTPVWQAFSQAILRFLRVQCLDRLSGGWRRRRYWATPVT
jgi:hypothetical protein